MNGRFRYIDRDGKAVEVSDSNSVPSSAVELTLFDIRPPPPPHSQADHDKIDSILAEFECVKRRVYGPCPE